MAEDQASPLSDTFRGPDGEYVGGYAEFSAYIASDSDLQIFRSFKDLTSRNLLMLQSELLSLEARLRSIDQEEYQSIVEAKLNCDDEELIKLRLGIEHWETFVEEASQSDANQSKTQREIRQVRKMNLVQELRRTLPLYQDALLRQSQVSALQRPSRRAKKAFSQWFRSKLPLRGHGEHILDSGSHGRDLVALAPTVSSDRLSTYLQDTLGSFFKEERGTPRSWQNIHYFQVEAVERLVTTITVFLSSFILLAAIIAMYFASSQDLKLGLLVMFVFVFTALVAWLTNARKAELVAATAAYTAVLVVYISNTGYNQLPN